VDDLPDEYHQGVPIDVLNAATPTEQLLAVTMAAFVELPLAHVCWRIAWMQPATEPIR
jgi:hypothetical protein